MNAIYFVVHGKSQPKGSSRAFMPKGWKRPVITSANPNLKKWEQTIRGELQQVMARTPPHVLRAMFDAPVNVRLLFHVARPKSLPKRVTQAAKRPDLDKLARAAIDALNGVLFRDDAQVIALDARKVYAEGPACLEVTVEAISAPLFESREERACAATV